MANYIDRDALIANLQRFAPDDYNANVNNIIMGMPRADVAQVVHGWWVKDEFFSDEVNNAAKCSQCGEMIGWFGKLPNYCPNCGAKMDGGANND